MFSPRRYGKSSLIRQAITVVRKRGGRCGIANLYFCSTPTQIIETIANVVIGDVLGWLRGSAEELRTNLSKIGLNFEIKLGSEGFRVEASESELGGDWRGALGRLLRVLQRAQTSKAPVALAIDEFQRVVDVDESIAGVFKAVADETPRLSLVLAGSQRRVMERLAQGPNAPLLGIGASISLGPIDRDEMIGYLRTRAGQNGRTIQCIPLKRGQEGILGSGGGWVVESD